METRTRAYLPTAAESKLDATRGHWPIAERGLAIGITVAGLAIIGAPWWVQVTAGSICALDIVLFNLNRTWAVRRWRADIERMKTEPVERPRQEIADQPKPALEHALRHVTPPHRERMLITTETLLGPHPPASAYFESYRTLRSEFLTISEREPFQTALVTSRGHYEGKSTVVLNLGTMLALVNRDTIIVDANFYGAGIGGILGLAGTVGLTDLCSGDADIDEALVETEIGGLRVIPAGRQSERGLELALGGAMKQAVHSIRDRAEFTVCDCTPISGFGATLALAQLVDIVFLVSLAGSQVTETQRCLESLKQVGARVGGVIVNDVLQDSVVYRAYHEYYR